MARSTYLTIYKQKISSTVSNSARSYYSYKFNVHFQVYPVQKSGSKSVIHFSLGFEGFCKQFSPILHAHSSQVHLLYRKIIVFNAAIYSLYVLIHTYPITSTHPFFRVLNTHSIKNPNYILGVIYLFKLPQPLLNNQQFITNISSSLSLSEYQPALPAKPWWSPSNLLEDKTDSSLNSGKQTMFFSSCKGTKANEAEDKVFPFLSRTATFPKYLLHVEFTVARSLYSPKLDWEKEKTH